MNQRVESQVREWEVQRRRRDDPPSESKRVVEDFVCVSRVFASGGGEITRLLGRRLGWPVFDREILHSLSGDDSLQTKIASTMSQRDSDWLEQAMRFKEPAVDDDFRRLAKTVLSLARQARSVFLGRAADLILPRRSGLRVRIAAPLDSCVFRHAHRQKIPLAEARREFERIEQERDAFIRRYFDVDPNDQTRYDLTLNLERFSTEHGVDLILHAMRLRGIGE